MRTLALLIITAFCIGALIALTACFGHPYRSKQQTSRHYSHCWPAKYIPGVMRQKGYELMYTDQRPEGPLQHWSHLTLDDKQPQFVDIAVVGDQSCVENVKF
jgi:hypothetical protein